MEESSLSEHGEDKDHGLWPQTEPSKKSGENPRCRKKCRLLWWMLSWIHKKCSGIKGSLRRGPDFSCATCLGKARPIDGRLVKEVLVDGEKVESVPEFCYLGDMLSAGGGYELATVTHCKSA